MSLAEVIQVHAVYHTTEIGVIGIRYMRSLVTLKIYAPSWSSCMDEKKTKRVPRAFVYKNEYSVYRVIRQTCSSFFIYLIIDKFIQVDSLFKRVDVPDSKC